MPSTQWPRLVLLAIIVILAGCTSPSTTQPDATPTPDPESSQADLPPGVTHTGVENASLLLQTHHTTLRDTGYRLDVVNSGSQMQYVATSNHSSYRVLPGSASSKPELWANDTLVLAQLTRNNETVYQRPPRRWITPKQMTGTRSLHNLFTNGQYTVSETQECANRQCFVLTATQSSRFQNFSARALVDENGIVREFRATYMQSDGPGSTSVEYQLSLVQLDNVTVSRPSWLDTALSET
jgi:hypothetical protein